MPGERSWPQVCGRQQASLSVNGSQMITDWRRIPEPTVVRMARYLAALRSLALAREETVSSHELARLSGGNAAQVRKDLSFFGREFGTPGVGYNVIHLKERITDILGLRNPRMVVLVGAGSLGTALCGYQGFEQAGLTIRAVFDNDPGRIGKRAGNLRVQDVAALTEANKELKADIGIMAVPASAAQEVAEMLVKAGIKSILNFAPARVDVPESVVVRRVDLTTELAVLSYFLSAASGERAQGPA